MDLQNSLDQNRESSEKIYIKEEIIDDISFNNTLDLKEEVASICDDEQGYILNSSHCAEIKAEPGVFVTYDSDITTTQEDEKFSFCLLNDDGTNLKQFSQDSNCPSFSAKRQKKTKRRKKRELKRKREVKIPQENTDLITKTGRISRDELFKNQEYFCSVCQKLYLGRKCFKKHFKYHFSVCKSHYVCLMCNYVSKNVSHINRHLLSRHFLQEQKNEKEKLFCCCVCDRSFYEKKDLERHMYVHTREGPLKCSKCDFSCVVKSRMESHMSLIHGNPRVSQGTDRLKVGNGLGLKCHHCTYFSQSRSALVIHIRRHVGEKFKCPDCDYSCYSQGDMQKHGTIHSDNRPFICDKCNKTFKRKNHLVMHFKGKCGAI